MTTYWEGFFNKTLSGRAMDYFSPALSQAAFHMKVWSSELSFRVTFHKNPGHHRQQWFCSRFGDSAHKSRKAADLRLVSLIPGSLAETSRNPATSLLCDTDLNLSTSYCQSMYFHVYFLLCHTILTYDNQRLNPLYGLWNNTVIFVMFNISSWVNCCRSFLWLSSHWS